MHPTEAQRITTQFGLTPSKDAPHLPPYQMRTRQTHQSTYSPPKLYAAIFGSIPKTAEAVSIEMGVW